MLVGYYSRMEKYILEFRQNVTFQMFPQLPKKKGKERTFVLFQPNVLSGRFSYNALYYMVYLF